MLDRRKILAAAAVGITTPALLRKAWAQADAIEIGSLVSLSGTFANIGEQVDIGSKIAFEHFKTAAGKPLRYVQLDDQGDPGRAVRLTQDAIRDRGIRFFMNCTNSAIALAVAKEVASGGGVYINQAGADEMTGSLCNKNTFRWPVATYSAVNTTVRPLMKQFPNAKKLVHDHGAVRVRRQPAEEFEGHARRARRTAHRQQLSFAERPGI